MSNLRAEVRKHLQAIRSNLAKVEGIAPLNRIEQGEYASEQLGAARADSHTQLEKITPPVAAIIPSVQVV